MEEFKGTKGEWKVSCQSFMGTAQFITLNDKEETFVAKAEGSLVNNLPDEEVKANAKLIAASPTLLENLQNTTKTLKMIVEHIRSLGDENRALIQRDIDLADSAIKKALD